MLFDHNMDWIYFHLFEMESKIKNQRRRMCICWGEFIRGNHYQLWEWF